MGKLLEFSSIAVSLQAERYTSNCLISMTVLTNRFRLAQQIMDGEETRLFRMNLMRM